MDESQTPLYGRKRRFSLSKVSKFAAPVQAYLACHKKGVAIVCLALFVFYWYELRPIQVNNTCMEQASVDARALLVNKAKVATDPVRRQSYQNLIDQNMYLRSDHESYYTRCMRDHGMNL